MCLRPNLYWLLSFVGAVLGKEPCGFQRNALGKACLSSSTMSSACSLENATPLVEYLRSSRQSRHSCDQATVSCSAQRSRCVSLRTTCASVISSASDFGGNVFTWKSFSRPISLSVMGGVINCAAAQIEILTVRGLKADILEVNEMALTRDGRIELNRPPKRMNYNGYFFVSANTGVSENDSLAESQVNTFRVPVFRTRSDGWSRCARIVGSHLS